MVGHTGKLIKTMRRASMLNLPGLDHEAHATGSRRYDNHRGPRQRRTDEDPQSGGPHTAHTTNPVPLHLIDEASRGLKLREGGALEDVAPTVLGLLGNEQPEEMTGRDLRRVRQLSDLSPVGNCGWRLEYGREEQYVIDQEETVPRCCSTLSIMSS